MSNFLKKYSTDKSTKSRNPSFTSNGSIPIVEDMTSEQIDAAFETVLDDMNLPDDKKHTLRLQSNVHKKQILDMNYRRTFNDKNENAGKFVAMLSKTNTKHIRRYNLLQTVRVHLCNDTLQWKKSFGRNGLLVLINSINTHLKAEETDCLKQAVLCIGCFINSKYGMDEALATPELICSLIECIPFPDAHILVEVIKIIAAICIYPSGHEKVLEGFTSVRNKKNSHHRFAEVVSILNGGFSLQVQSVCLQLVNAVVSTPEEWEFRQHLRCEIMRAGLGLIYESLCQNSSPDVNRQVEIFQKQFAYDLEELKSRFDHFSGQFQSLDDTWNFLRTVVTGTESEAFLTSIFQHMLFIRDDSFSRNSYFSLIDSVVSQIVLQKGGINPDPQYRTIQFDFEHLTNKFEARMKKKDREMAALREQYETRLNAALTAKMEAESKSSLLGTRFELCDGMSPKSVNKTPIQQKSFKIERQVSACPKLECAVPPPPPPMVIGGKVPPPPPSLQLRAPTVVKRHPVVQLPHGMTQKPKMESSTVTKHINWTQIKPETFGEDCFWVKAREGRFFDSSLLESLEQLFASQKTHATGNEDGNKRRLRELRVIDSNTSQAISILIANLKLSPEELQKEFLAVNCAIIQPATLEQLLKALPEENLMKKLLDYSKEYDDLTDSEKYLFKLSEIQGLRNRVELMLFMSQFDESISETKSAIATMTEACGQVMESLKLSQVMEVVLLIGNILNLNTRNAETYGFDITILPRLVDTRSVDGTTSFMHFLVETVEKKCPESLTFGEDLVSVRSAANVSIDVICQSISQYERNLNRLATLIPNYESLVEGDYFVDVFQDFYERVIPQQELIVDMKSRMDDSVNSMFQFFALSPRSTSCTAILESIAKFSKQFKDTVDEINHRKENENRRKNSLNKRKTTLSKYEANEGIMESLLEALKSGSAFKHAHRKRGNEKPLEIKKI